MLHCNCNNCTYNHTDVMPPSQLYRHLGQSVTTFKLMVKQALGDGILLGDMLKIINTDLIDTHIGHCCRCRGGSVGGNELLRCDGCPLSYHTACVGLAQVPDHDWYCPKCIQWGRGGKKRQIRNTQPAPMRAPPKTRPQGLSSSGKSTKRKSETSRQALQNGSSSGKQINRTQTMTGNKFRNQRLFSSEAGLLKDGQEVWYRSNKENILRGNVVISGEVRGILCSCCNQIVSMSTFEKHAGFGHRRAPYDCVYLVDGPNLKELAQRLPQDESLDFVLNRCKRRKVTVRRVGTTAKRSTNNAQKDQKLDARTKLIIKRFEGIISALETVPPGCHMCHQEEFDPEFSDKTMIICDQCEREFHIGCLREQGICDLQALPQENWFCGKECKRVYQTIRQKLREEEYEHNNNYQVRIMRGTREDNNQSSPLFSQACALELIRESFDPIKDGITGVDLLPYMVKSDATEDGAWDFAGMCTLLLKYNYKIVGAATFRVFGNLVAEIPLVAVKSADRGKGYCRVMINLLEELFQQLDVKIMILPAAQTTLNMWLNKFQCFPLGPTNACRLRSFAKFMCFPDCTLVYKYLDGRERVVQEDEDISDILNMPDHQVRQVLQELKAEDNNRQENQVEEKKKEQVETVEQVELQESEQAVQDSQQTRKVQDKEQKPKKLIIKKKQLKQYSQPQTSEISQTMPEPESAQTHIPLQFQSDVQIQNQMTPQLYNTQYVQDNDIDTDNDKCRDSNSSTQGIIFNSQMQSNTQAVAIPQQTYQDRQHLSPQQLFMAEPELDSNEFQPIFELDNQLANQSNGFLDDYDQQYDDQKEIDTSFQFQSNPKTMISWDNTFGLKMVSLQLSDNLPPHFQCQEEEQKRGDRKISRVQSSEQTKSQWKPCAVQVRLDEDPWIDQILKKARVD
eukprot:TRINITY_DN16415_c0_g1_i12.p1 TRINITY_DN16415_c0_g1~~TRINITY_DN16415_c0_g1_i12.p1  ORF type:complete len:974 (-),score=131.77 TRINITY_DN16415_c0_g1_i12:369-3089(-)